jgi:hypothetical protein
MKVEKSPLDEPENARFAWARFKRLMALMVGITLAVVATAIVWLYDPDGQASVHFYIATALGIGLMMLLTAGLMGLVFLSSGTGHDEAVDNNLPGFDDDVDGSTQNKAPRPARRPPIRWKDDSR